jgi:type IV pilus assembly protein PilY1
MTRTIRAIFSVMVVIVASLSVVGDDSRAQTVTNATYAAVPPFVGGTNSTPNVLFLLDNSGSMDDRACRNVAGNVCGVLANGDLATTNDFTPTTKYSGYFDSLGCYDYEVSGTTERFHKASAKATLNATCGTTYWDGNLLNWISFRRFDAAKLAMIGGDCVVARAADGTCPAIGTPSRKTIGAQAKFSSAAAGFETDSIPLAIYDGRIPDNVAKGNNGANPKTDPIYFHLRGGLPSAQNPYPGNICVDNDSSGPASSAAACDDGGGFEEQVFRMWVGLDTEPTGVLQQVGTQARFGLAVFSTDNQGSRVLVGIGSRQAIDFNATTVETFTTNTAAMIDGIQESFPTTSTPLAESLYEVVRYIAQINSYLHPATGYEYPIAFSGGSSNGVAFRASGTGSIGSSEITVLTGSETCPTGYIASACGRDPYFFGSNHSPMWASPSSVVTCCQTFIIVFTDGEPTQDLGVPSALQDYAHAVHGIHCTGSNGTLGSPADATCNTHPQTASATLLGEHKTDYGSNGRHYLDDVAYWAHTVDLRQATIPVINESGHDLPGKQNVTIYTFFAFGNINGREIMMQAAKQGGFDDVNDNGIPESGEYDKVNNATGAAGADGQPDTYFESSNVEDMKDKLIQVLSSILQRSTSGTSLSVLATSTTGEGALYQSFFFPKVTEGLINVYWIGYTQALFLDTFGNLREDTDGDGRLVYKNDMIIKTRYDSATGEVKADLYRDTSPSPDGDGLADSTTPTSTVALKDIKPVWEAGKKLALRDDSTTPRKILTWIDSDGDGLVDSSEQIAFTTANRGQLQPYLRAADTTESGNIISWIRGNIVSGYRNRELTVSGSTKTWKYGDTIHSTPTVVAAPRERPDIIYGDTSYSAFFQQYRTRRQVAYVGGNDGMLHAFNAGFYNPGDDGSTTSAVERGWFTTQKVTAPFVTNTPAIGEELWAFVPQELLPQLKFLTQGDYQHVYYVDQKPKITDARIFCDGSSGAPTSPNCVTGQGSGSSHPNGWGTILIGAFRLGGSCRNCTTGGTELSVTADFSDPADGDTTDPTDTRVFRSAYFALDITDPELDPKLLWVFTDADMGLTLGYPTMARLRPDGGDKTTNSDARWFMAVGSGPTGYDVGSVQTANLYVVDIVKKAASNTLNTAYYKFPTIQTCGAASPNSECSLIGNVVTVDTDLDYRADVFYFGNIICNASAAPCNGTASSTWKGRFYRLTTGSSANPALGTETDPCGWGVGSGSCARTPSVLLDDFACAGSCAGTSHVGPVSAAANVAQDDVNKIWVYWGTGRYFANSDKTNADTQHFFGVKDLVPTSGCTQSSATACEEKDLLNVSGAEVCVIGTTTGSGTCTATSQVTGVTGVDSFDSSSGSSNTLVGAIQNKDGWYTTLDDQDPATPTRERSLSQPAIIGGLVFFPTFEPENDICSSSGSSFLYALFYKSGTANKESVIGTVTQGSNTNVSRRAAIGDPGLASGVAVHMGAQGSGANGSGGGGCQGQLTANIQSSTGSVGQTCLKTAGVPWSYYISWTSQRDS